MADLLLLRHMISWFAGLFQSSPTFLRQVSKYRSQLPSALIPRASRYHLSLPLYCEARSVQICAASAELFPLMAIATSLLTCAEGSFFNCDAVSNRSCFNCRA